MGASSGQHACFLCGVYKSGQKNKGKRKLDAESLQTCLCVGCRRPKIADAFPRAQLVQAEADVNRQCLECLETQRTEMQCCMCSRSKSLHGFSPRMVTMPANGILCLQCQDKVRRQTRTCTRHGYIIAENAPKFIPWPCANCKAVDASTAQCVARVRWGSRLAATKRARKDGLSKRCRRKDSVPHAIAQTAANEPLTI